MATQSQARAIPGPFTNADRQAILAWAERHHLNFRTTIHLEWDEFSEVAEVWCRRPDTLLYVIHTNPQGVTLESQDVGSQWSVDFVTTEEALAYLLAVET